MQNFSYTILFGGVSLKLQAIENTKIYSAFHIQNENRG